MININYPRTLKYTNSHLWLLVIENDYAFVGITSYALKEIGKVLTVNINRNGLALGQHAEFGYVAGDSGKILELIMPFTEK